MRRMQSHCASHVFFHGRSYLRTAHPKRTQEPCRRDQRQTQRQRNRGRRVPVAVTPARAVPGTCRRRRSSGLAPSAPARAMASLQGHQHLHGAAESQLLHGVLDELLPQSGGAADADALDALLAGEDDELWNAPALFGNLAPGLQCSEACHRPGQRCLDPTHSAHCTKCVAPRRAPDGRLCFSLGLGRPPARRGPASGCSASHAVPTTVCQQPPRLGAWAPRPARCGES